MKKITTLLLAMSFAIISFSQQGTTQQNTADAKIKTELLSVVGGLSAAYLLNTQELINSLVTMHTSNQKTDEQLKSSFSSQKAILTILIQQADKLLDTKALDPDTDQVFFERFNSLITAIRQEVELYLDYTSTKNQAKKTEFETKRSEVKKGINELLGLE
jgi:hypothetical protein